MGKNKTRTSRVLLLLQLELCSPRSVCVEAAELSRDGAAIVQEKHQQAGAQKRKVVPAVRTCGSGRTASAALFSCLSFGR